MSEQPKIPIRNIYYLLCYAWGILPQANDRLAGLETYDHIYNLLAKLMITYVNNTIKRGFHREYVRHEEELALVKGKIDVLNTIKQQSMIRKRLVCQFDDFSDNVLFNQIVKTTMNKLIKYPLLNHKLKKELITARYHFSNIKEISLSGHIFMSLRYNRNNLHYKMLLHISELLHMGLISNEQGNTLQFPDFIRDKKMATLYEKFILNFYKKHLPSNQYKTHSPKINWQLDANYSHVGTEYLPDMNTDITIENRIENTQLIIDAKYYASALKARNHSEVKKLISTNLYQISTYASNSSYNGDVSGLLLYPTTEHELDLTFKINGRLMMIKTLNLAEEWEDIYKRLLDIAVY